MPTTERTRHDMLNALQSAIGEEAAMTLAEHLPPTGWGDVATRRDIEHLEQRLTATSKATDARFAAMDSSIDARFAAMDKSIDEKLATTTAILRAEMQSIARSLEDKISTSARTTNLINASVLIALLGVVLSNLR